MDSRIPEEKGPSPDAPWALLAASWEELFPLRPARVELALSLSHEGAATLDAGCATGSLPRALADRGRLAHGLDLDPSFLEEARRLGAGRPITWHHAGLEGMEEAAGGTRFALITCLGQTLPHLLEEAQWSAFFAQARRLLAPGGHLAIQVVNDAQYPVGHVRELPPLRIARGTLERRRTVLPHDLALFETVFRPAGGAPVHSRVQHRRMGPERALALLRAAGLDPAPPLADEAGAPFTEASPGWMLIAQRVD